MGWIAGAAMTRTQVANVAAKKQIGVLVVAVCCLLSRMSLAETPADLAVKAHLLGTWAYDCSKPPEVNYYATYEATEGGGVRAKYDFGNGLAGTFYDALDRLIFIDKSTISLRVRRLDRDGRSVDRDGDKRPRGTWNNIILIEGDRLQLLQSTYGSGSVQVKNGIDLASGQPVPELHRCRGNEKPTT